MHRKFRRSFRIFSVSTFIQHNFNLSKTIDTVRWSFMTFFMNNTIIFEAYKGLVINKIFTKDITTIIIILQMEKIR